MTAPHRIVLLVALAAFGIPALAAPAAALTVTVRRDGVSLIGDDAHSYGVSGIVSGTTTANTLVTVTLTHPGGPTVRTTTSDGTGKFGVSMDRNIEDGDTVVVSDPSTSRTIPIPTLSYAADPVTMSFAGIGPASVTSTAALGPHTLQLRIGPRASPSRISSRRTRAARSR
jgi:hypothetical protein